MSVETNPHNYTNMNNTFSQFFKPARISSALKPHALPEYLEGRTPKENTLSFFIKKFTPAKSEMQGVFFLSGLLAYSPVRGAFSERTGQFQATSHAERAKSLPHFVLEIGASLVQYRHILVRATERPQKMF